MTNPTPELEASPELVKMAFAIYADDYAGSPNAGILWRAAGVEVRNAYLSNAKAALLALQEPTEGMLQASPIYNRERGANVWRAMINHILGERS